MKPYMFYICSMSRLHILWVSRDLRVHDNAALVAACRAAERDGGQVLPLYVFDPKDWQSAAVSARQFDFLIESLRDLDQALRQRGSALQVEIGDAETVLLDLHRRKGLAALHLHETPGETDKTRAIETLCRRAGIPFRVHGQNGITSTLNASTDWRSAWRATMTAPRVTAPARIDSPPLVPANWPDAKQLSLPPSWLMQAQKGGRAAAIDLVRTHLPERRASSDNSPALIDQLSAHLSLGTLSAREVWQRLQKAYAGKVASREKTSLYLRDQLKALEDWCHAAQQAATRPVSGGGKTANSVKQETVAKLRAWKNGRCGVPIIDAGMRAVLIHGSAGAWLQPVLIDYAQQILGLSKSAALDHLSSLCTAADPRLGTGMPNQTSDKSSRARLQQIYRASKALDPDGIYIRHWVPELADLPTEFLHAPSEAPVHALIEADIVIGQTYPNPGAEDGASAVPAILSAPRPKRPKKLPRRPTKPNLPDPKTGQFSLAF